jgi:hypothetical protein
MLREAGLLYHIADPSKRTWGIWPVSMEGQSRRALPPTSLF